MNRAITTLFTLSLTLALASAQRTERLALNADTSTVRDDAAENRGAVMTSALPRVVRYSGGAPEQSGSATVIFAIFDQSGSSPLWSETQVVNVSGGKFSALLGSTSSQGIPSEIFAADQARWLSVTVNGGTPQKSLLVSVPYAMKALEAERIAGRSAQDFVSNDQLEAAVKRVISAKSTKIGPETSSAPGADSTATDFTDLNGTEVLLVTQNGGGYAINAISTASPAVRGLSAAVGLGTLRGENSASGGYGVEGISTSTTGASFGVIGVSASDTGRGIRGVATHPTGATIGVQGQVFSPSGAAIQGDNSATSGIALGVRGVTNSTAGKALAGLALAATGASTAIDGQNASNAGTAIFANATSTSGSTFGLLARVNSPNGTAARFESSSAAATATLFSGISNNVQRFIVKGDGHLISTNVFTDGIAIEGNSTLTGNHFGYGVVGATKSDKGAGVIGTTTAAGNGLSSGVQGYVTGTAGVGVWGEATNTAGGSIPIGVYGVVNNATATGGVFENKDAAGKIVNFLSNGGSIAFVDASGFHGSGANLTSIPGSAIVGSISGNAATATSATTAAALAANGTNCAAGQFASGVDAAGNAEGCSSDGSSLTNLNPANLAAGIAGIDISGNAATATSATSANTANTANDALALGGVLAANYAQTTYVDAQDAATLAAANNYTDGQITTVNGAITAGDTAAVAAANTYTDSQITTVNGSITAGDAATLASANTYTDGQVAGVSTSVATETANRIAADAATLASANSYTDGQIATEQAARVAGDANTAKTNTANIFAGDQKQTFTAGATNSGINLAGVTADPSTLADGDLWFRSDNGAVQMQVGGVTKTLAFTDTPFAGNAATATALAANGTNCAAGQFAAGVDASGNAEGCSNDGSSLTNLDPTQLTSGTANIDISGNAATATSATSASTANTANDALALGGVAAAAYAQTADVDTKDAATLASANAYTDGQITAVNGAVTAGDAATLASANSYTDTQVAAETAARSSADTGLQNNITSGDAATLAAANTYTDGQITSVNGAITAGDTASVATANAYTDAAIATEQANRIAADAATLAAANTYTDGQLATESAARIAGDANAAKTNTANTFAADQKQTFTAGATNAGMNLAAVGADPSTLADGDVWFRSDDGHIKVQVSGVTKTITFSDDPVTGTAAQAVALAANGTNCAAGQFAAGVDASGNAEGCSNDGSSLTNVNPANLAAGTAGIDISGNAATATSASSATTANTANDALALGGVAAANYAQTTYVDAQDAATLAAANAYTDGQITAVNGAITAGDAATLASANSYTDTQVAAEAAARSSADTNLQNNITAGDAATLAAANTYTDSQVAGVSVSIATETANRIAADATTLASANSYTDGQIATEQAARIAGDANTAKTNTANIFAADQKQTFTAGATNAGLNLAGVAADPSSLADGDVWFRSDNSAVHMQVGGVTKTLAFTDSSLSGDGSSLTNLNPANIAAGTANISISGNAATATSATAATALAANGTNCAAGQFAVGVDASGNAEGCSNDGSSLTNLTAANIAAGTAGISITGNAATATTATTATSATNFTGSLTGDVTGTQGAAVVSTVGGQSAASVASAATAANAATNLNTASTIVKRDASGNFTAGTITANLVGNVTGNVSTATALAANGVNCSGNNFALGVDASGAAECAQPAFSNLSGTAAVGQGGTGVTSSGAAGNYLRSNGTGWAASTIQLSDLPNLSGAFVDLTTNQSIAGTKAFTGAVDATAAANTLPVRAVTLATTPSGPGACVANKELIIKMDENPGRQLFICNSTGTGYQLLGDGLGQSGVTFNQVNIAADTMTLDKNTCSATYTGTYPNAVADQDLPIPPVSGQLTSTSTLVVSPLSPLTNQMPSGWTSYTYYAYVDSTSVGSGGPRAFLHVCNPTQFNQAASGAIQFNVRALN